MRNQQILFLKSFQWYSSETNCTCPTSSRKTPILRFVLRSWPTWRQGCSSLLKMRHFLESSVAVFCDPSWYLHLQRNKETSSFLDFDSCPWKRTFLRFFSSEVTKTFSLKVVTQQWTYRLKRSIHCSSIIDSVGGEKTFRWTWLLYRTHWFIFVSKSKPTFQEGNVFHGRLQVDSPQSRDTLMFASHCTWQRQNPPRIRAPESAHLLSLLNEE